MTEYFKKDGDEFVEVKEALHTQADLDRVVKERADRIARSQFADYDELKEKASKVDTIASEYEDKLKGATTKQTELEKELGKAKLETVKVTAIHDFKLSKELAEFVDGDDEKTIRAKAEKLSKGVGGSSFQIDKTPKPDDKTSDTKKVAQGLFGKKSDD